MPAHPAPPPVVQPDYAAVGGGADAEVEPVVGAEHQVGDAVVALRGKAGDDGASLAVVGNGGDDAEVVLVAVGDVDDAVAHGHAADRAEHAERVAAERAEDLAL